MVLFIIYISQYVFDKSQAIPILGVFALASFKLIPSIVRIANNVQSMKFCYPSVQPYVNNNSRLEFDFNRSNKFQNFSQRKRTFNCLYW